MRYRGGVRSRSVDSQDLPDLLLLRSCLAAVYLDLPRRSRFALRAAFGSRYSASLRLPTLGYTFVFPLGQGAIARVFSTFPKVSIL